MAYNEICLWTGHTLCSHPHSAAVQYTLPSALSSSRLLCEIAHRGYWRLREEGEGAPCSSNFPTPPRMDSSLYLSFASSKLEDLIDPVLELGYSRVDAGLVLLRASDAPTDHSGEHEAAVLSLHHHRPTAVALRKEEIFLILQESVSYRPMVIQI